MTKTTNDTPDFEKSANRFLKAALPVFEDIDKILMTSAASSRTWFTIGSLRDRSRSTLRSIVSLHRLSSHDCRIDCATLLRAMYDAHLQFIYIMNEDSGIREERASEFARFGIIDHFEYYSQLEAGGCPFPVPSAEMAADIENQRRLVSEWKPSFLGKNGKLRRQWFRGTLRDIAEQVGRSEEYDYLLKLLHMQTHSGPATRHFRSLWRTDWCVILGVVILARQYVRLAEVLELPVAESNLKLLRVLSFGNGIRWAPSPY